VRPVEARGTFSGVSVDTLLAVGALVVCIPRRGDVCHRYTHNLPLSTHQGHAWSSGSTAVASACRTRRPSPPARTHLYFWKRPSGFRACASSTMTSRVLGGQTATTTEVTPGWKSAIRVTDSTPAVRSRKMADCSCRRVHPDSSAKTFRLRLPDRSLTWRAALRGSLTAPTATRLRVRIRWRRHQMLRRSRSPSNDLPDGEVSSFLHDEVVVGTRLKCAVPIGGWFVWRAIPRPCSWLGDRVVPLMAMLRLPAVRGERPPPTRRFSPTAGRSLLLAGAWSALRRPSFTAVSPTRLLRPPGHMSSRTFRRRCPSARRATWCGSSGFADVAASLLIGAALSAKHDSRRAVRPTR